MRAESSAKRPTQASADSASLPGGADHLGLVCDHRGQDFLRLALCLFEMVEPGGDLGSDLVELLRGDVQMGVGPV
jgi:hypothetical protein